jgi:hypothetical protein
MLISSKCRLSTESITTRDLQSCLKVALKRVEIANFDERLGTVNFDKNNILKFRSMCQNSKLRNIYFRLIHNDFFTHERMMRYKMTNSDKCKRCGEIETTKHLLWECPHVRNIWSIFNNLMTTVNRRTDCVNQYDDVYVTTSSAGTTLIKIKLIQELIQIERPKNWGIDNLKQMITKLTNIEKYNSIKSRTMIKYAIKWSFLNST